MSEKTINEIRNEIPVWKKINISFDEAAALSNIGRERLREMARTEDYDFFIKVGPGKTVINRERFENFLKNRNAI